MTHPEPAQPEVKKSRNISIVWLIPIIAIAVGAWLFAHTLSQQGPTIQISFESAEGLEAGKTKVKLRDVPVGLVTQIRLGDEPSYVIVEAEIAKHAERFIRSDTSFWVVRPRIQGTNVSGLGTLVSGAYIALAPGSAASDQSEFVGLASPPLIAGGVLGKHFILEAERRGSLSPGSPIYLRDLDVGEVTSVNLTDDNRHMEVHIFIREPYHELVLSTTRFWNASGIDFSVSADGVDVQIASLETLVSGGIAFETLDEDGRVPPENARFHLYNNRNQIDDFGFTEKIRYVMYFDHSVRGLTVNSPVEFRGIKLGSVIRISAEFDVENTSVQIPVIVEIEPERIERLFLDAKNENASRKNINSLVGLGLRAQLQTGSLLTGKLFVALDFHPETTARLVGRHSSLPELPTIPTTLGKFEDSATAIINRLQQLPVEQISQNLLDISKELKLLVKDPIIRETVVATKSSIGELNRLLEDLNTRVVPKLESTVTGYDSTSDMYYQLIETLEEFRKASKAMRALAEQLERSPESIVRGKR